MLFLIQQQSILFQRLLPSNLDLPMSILAENTSNKGQNKTLTLIPKREHFTLVTQYLLIIFQIINNVCQGLSLATFQVFT